MLHDATTRCSDCESPAEFSRARPGRREFLRTLGASAATVVGGSLVRAADAPAKSAAKPAEDLVRELRSTLSAEQQKTLVLPWDHGGPAPTRLKMMNSAPLGLRIGEQYTAAQQELNLRILKSICNGEEGFDRISRKGRYDEGKGFQSCGAVLFGDPKDEKQFSWVFAGHHLTVRCDGNSEPGAAFGGPMYYGDSQNGYSEKNSFYYQTKAVESVFAALDGKQQKAAVVGDSPGEQARSVEFRPAGQTLPGIACRDLSADQRGLVEKVMQAILSPYRKEDADEVMQIVKANGGLEQVHLAFYEDKQMRDGQRWHFWRLEGPGLVWNYRVLPHVHTYVQIRALKA